MSNNTNAVAQREIDATSALFIGLGIACLYFFLMAIAQDVATSEALLQHTQLKDFSFHWDILGQIPEIISNTLPKDLQGPAFIGWGIELICFVVIVGLNKARHAIGRSHPFLGGMFVFFSVCFVAYNIYTNIHNGPVMAADGFLGHVIFTAVNTFCALFFGIIGMVFLEHGFKGKN